MLTCKGCGLTVPSTSLYKGQIYYCSIKQQSYRYEGGDDGGRRMTNEEIEQLYQDGIRDGKEMVYREMLAFLETKLPSIKVLKDKADRLSRLEFPDTTGR